MELKYWVGQRKKLIYYWLLPQIRSNIDLYRYYCSVVSLNCAMNVAPPLPLLPPQAHLGSLQLVVGIVLRRKNKVYSRCGA
jgi:hypothetical protein